MNRKTGRVWVAVLASVLVFAFSLGVFAAPVLPPSTVPISKTLTASVTVLGALLPSDWLALTLTGMPASVRINTPVILNTTATKDLDAPATINNVLYIIDIMKDTIPATNLDVVATVTGQDAAGNPLPGPQPVGYSVAAQCFYFGPPAGFTYSAAGTITNAWTVTFLQPGSYSINAYTVQIPTPLQTP